MSRDRAQGEGPGTGARDRVKYLGDDEMMGNMSLVPG